MRSQLKYAFKYLKYWLLAKHKKGHGIHSPFVYDLITEVFNHKKNDPGLKNIFDIHSKYRKSKKPLAYHEMGAGTHVKNINGTKSLKSAKALNPRKVSSTIGKTIRKSSVTKKYGRLIYQLVKHYKPENILEIGTSLGISTLYLASGSPEVKIATIEGVKEKAQIAQKLAHEINLTDIHFIVDDFDSALPEVIKKFDKLDVVFFDGNHTKNSTLKYFNICLNKANHDSIFIFDDIHWSEEMEQAWDTIINHEKVQISLDLFRMGIVFFRPGITPGNYLIKF